MPKQNKMDSVKIIFFWYPRNLLILKIQFQNEAHFSVGLLSYSLLVTILYFMQYRYNQWLKGLNFFTDFFGENKFPTELKKQMLSTTIKPIWT